MTLEEFITAHKDLVSVTGVFAALSLFAQTFMGGIFGTTLALMFYSAFVLLWLELWSTFPKDGTRRLAFFENVLTVAVVMTVIYWYAQAYKLSPGAFAYAVGLPIGAFILTFVSKVVQKYQFFDRVFGSSAGSSTRYAVGITVAGAVVILVVAVTDLIVERYDEQLEEAFSPILLRDINELSADAAVATSTSSTSPTIIPEDRDAKG